MIEAWEKQRHSMIEEQLRPRGIVNVRVLHAMRRVPRELFVPANVSERSYEDRALPLGHSQTISQPYMVAVMLQALALTGDERVLEIGTGTGYQAALLSLLAAHIDSIELVPELSHHARKILRDLSVSNVTLHIGDGSIGMPQELPFDAIVVAAGAPDVPTALYDQLKDGGRLLLPLGDRKRQVLTLIQKDGTQMRRETLGNCRFVPLRGAFGWA